MVSTESFSEIGPYPRNERDVEMDDKGSTVNKCENPWNSLRSSEASVACDKPMLQSE
jgi:hypothetical protein